MWGLCDQPAGGLQKRKQNSEIVSEFEVFAQPATTTLWFWRERYREAFRVPIHNFLSTADLKATFPVALHDRLCFFFFKLTAVQDVAMSTFYVGEVRICSSSWSYDGNV